MGVGSEIVNLSWKHLVGSNPTLLTKYTEDGPSEVLGRIANPRGVLGVRGSSPPSSANNIGWSRCVGGKRSRKP